MKEAHALDIRVIHDEIDILNEQLAEISDTVNGTDASKVDSLDVGQNLQTERVQKMIQRLESDMKTSEESFANAAELLKNGFKSFKSWHVSSLKEMEEHVLDLTESLKRLRQDWFSRLDKLQRELAETNQNINQQKKSFTSFREELRQQTSQVRRDVEETCTSEIQRHGVSTETKLDELQYQIDKINEGLPTYSIMKEEWQFVFRAQSGNGVHVYDAWVSGRDARTTFPTEEENYSFGNDHYRNPVVDSWNNLGVMFVRVTLYDKYGKEVAFVLFDGVRTDKMNWFSKERILDSSWSQLRYDSPLNHASIAGEAGLNRRFFINVRYTGCENDHGFMLVLDRGPMPCNYEKLPNHPLLLYSEFPGGTRWSSMYFGRAEYMVITIQTT